MNDIPDNEQFFPRLRPHDNNDPQPQAIDPEPKPEPAVPFEKLKRMFRASVDGTAENNAACIRDRDYYDGDQISLETRRKLLKRGQPVHANNKIFPAVNGILGIIDAAENDPVAYARTPQARDAADLASKVLRYVADKAEYKRARKAASANLVIQGTCAVIVEWDNDKQKTTAQSIAWEDFFYDPFSREHDFSDARYMGIAKWLDADDVANRFPEAYAAMGDPFTTGGSVHDSKDLETRHVWVDPGRKRLRVVDMYYRDPCGCWHLCVFCENGIFYCGESDYKDDEGNTLCPIEAVSFEVKQNGDRYGAVRNMISLQDGINNRESKLLQLVNSRQVRQTDLSAPATNEAIAVREAAKPDGAIPYGWEPLPAPDLMQGQMLGLQQSRADLDRLAPTPALLGRVDGSNESGRARQILQQAGMTELVRATGRFTAMELRVYRQMWFRTRQFFHGQQYIRVTGDGRAAEHILINEPVMGTGMDPQTGQPALMQVGAKNHVAEMDVDIDINSIPASGTLQQEVFEMVLNYASSNQMSPLSPEFIAVLKISPLPNARGMAEELEAAAQEIAQQNAPAAEAQQQAQQVALDAQHAKAIKDMANANKSSAHANKTELEVEMMKQALLPTAVPPLPLPPLQ